ncbi:cation:proton antiporter [Methylophaga sp. OBS4]|uniref:cation:proton antiporter n=1 Tax=Methylophaga sp. OBS4 TaxID=2991935 RepID=UPI00224CEFC3|nr:cation:proton antiporter [Methylophaga sp. OBS4]MCX4186257.1 cation:proton antiporter [Methylophaga sp. OBS4]
MNSSVLLVLGLLLVTGLLLSLLAARTNTPRIAAYAVAGLLWSPDLLGGWLGLDMTSWSGPLTDSALAIVAYLIGGSVTATQLRRLGKTIVFCTAGEVIGAVVLVTVSIWWLMSGQTTDALLLAVVLGTLAASTAPAATVAVIYQYRSKGPLTTTLLGVVALDDAVGIVLFSLMLVWVTGSSLMNAAVSAGTEILGALILGALMGWLLAYLGRRVRNRNFFLPMVLASLLLSQGLAQQWHCSPLLTAMAMGFFARATFKSGGERLFAPIEYLEELVFLTFFTLAGAHFKLSVLMQGIELVSIYVLARVIGKVLGARLAAQLCAAPERVRNYIGLAVVPQAGIAIGLALSLLHHPVFADTGLLIVNVILASTLIYELLGPLATRFALFRAGEIKSGAS